MAINVEVFRKLNVIDSCAVWHVLSSPRLAKHAIANGVHFSMTKFVEYECLTKRRSPWTPERDSKLKADAILKDRLKTEQHHGRFLSFSLDISDLQRFAKLEQRRRLGHGEISSIAFAMKTGQAILTDDQNARKLARTEMEPSMIQTTPHLFGWMIYSNILGDSDKDPVISEHIAMEGKLGKYLEQAYSYALQCKLMRSATE